LKINQVSKEQQSGKRSVARKGNGCHTFITFAEGAGISDFAYWQNLNTLGMSSTSNLSFNPLSTMSKKRAYGT
jgi:hypothetical protein